MHSFIHSSMHACMYRHGHGGGILSRQERKRKREKRDSDKGYMHIHTYMYMMNKKEGVFDGHGCTGRREGGIQRSLTRLVEAQWGEGEKRCMPYHTMTHHTTPHHDTPHHVIPCNTMPHCTIPCRFDSRQDKGIGSTQDRIDAQLGDAYIGWERYNRGAFGVQRSRVQ
jgi:hypothetical protein